MEDINSANIETLEKAIDEARRIGIVTHMKPDGDAIGSSVAMYHYLKACGKSSVKVILNDRQPAYLDFLTDSIPMEDLIISEKMPAEADILLRDSDLVFCLDFNAFHRTDRLEKALTESKADKILIDHHLDPDRSAFSLVFSETDISSASELVYQILIETRRIAHDASALPQMSATALMTGMTTDTNNFANSTYPSTLLMAAELIERGVDRDRIVFNLYNQYGENRLRLLGHILKDLLTITDDGVAYVVLDKDTLERYGIEEGDTEGFVNMPLSIDRVRMSLLLKEDKDRVRVSIRSKKGISANRCSKLHFNGGGHENAAGGRLNIPEDISDMSQAAEYIERHTHIFITEENEA